MPAVLCLPYFAFAWRDTYQYIFVNVLGQRSAIWQFHGTILQHLRYYYDLPNHAGSFLLGIGHVYLLSGIVLAGMVLTLRRAALPALAVVRPAHRRRVMSFAIPACERTKNPFFGATFQSLLLLSAVISLRRLLRCGRCARTRRIHRGMRGRRLFPASSAQPRRPGTLTHYFHQPVAGPSLRNGANGQIGDRIFIPAPGTTVSWNTMNYLSMVDETHRRFSNLEFSHYDDAAALADELDQADWVVAGDPGNNKARMDLPNGQYGLAGYLAAVKSQARLCRDCVLPGVDRRA